MLWKKRPNSKFVLIAIVFIAFLLRFYKLADISTSLTWDEAAWGYNAYSLGIDGRDEFGRFLPLDYIESFGDYKPPVYAYLAVLPVKIFGLSEFAVRFPSAFFGTLTVLVTYFLVKELFRIRNQESRIKHKRISNFKFQISNFALLSALLLALSPWHINLSRAAFEANVASFFLISGVWLFLLSMRRNAWLLILSAISFVVSLYTFNTARIVAPLLVLMLGIGFYKQLLQNKKVVLITVFVGIILSLPYAKFALTPQAKLRYHEVNIFSDSSIVETANQEIENASGAWWAKILNNRRWGYTRSYIKHYLDHFNPGFLFIKGDGNPKFSTQDVGQLYLWELPFLIIGTLYLFKQKEGYWWIIPAWLLIGMVPAATARETPHALRIETTLPMWQIIIAYGIVKITDNKEQITRRFKVARLEFSNFLLSAICFLLFLNVIYYLHGYYSHYPIEYSREWQYGYKEAIGYAESVKDDYDKIVFTTVLGRPYIYSLFYGKYKPDFFRKTANVEREVLGFVHINSFGKYVFVKNPKDYKKQDEKILFIDTSENIEDKTRILKTFYLLNKEPILIAYE